MIAEGVIALIGATLAISFFHTPETLNAVLAEGGPGLVVNKISISLMGQIGGILAIIGVVVLPITSGDTAFRSARLVIADIFKISQKERGKRLMIAIPLFVVGFLISRFDFGIIWRYFGWANQSMAAVVLWASAMYLAKNGKMHWIATIPAIFMTAVVTSFIANAGIGFNLPMNISTSIGIASGVVATIAFFWKTRQLPIPSPETGQ
jgi:carbon starvation protein CstA